MTTQVLDRAWRGLLALAAVLLIAASTLVASPAAAHDRLIGSDPAAGATVDGSPEALTLTFSGVISPDPGASDVQVTDAAGTQLAGDPVATDNTLTVPLVAQGEGAVTVLWKVVSSDGHPISGEYSFTITAAAEPEPAETPETTEPTTEPTEAAPDETEAASPTATPVPIPAAVDMTPWIIVGIVVVLLVAAAVIYLVASRSRRRNAAASGSQNPSER